MVQLLEDFNVGVSPSKKNCLISFNEGPLKMMKTGFIKLSSFCLDFLAVKSRLD